MKTIIEQIGAAKRELNLRRNVFPLWIEKHKMTQLQADHEIECMKDIVATLTKIKLLNEVADDNDA